MSKTWRRWAEDVWYKDAFLGILMLPLAYVFSDIVRLRRFFYVKGLKKSHKLPVPVIVVGNITVGGTGKTPLVIWLADLLKNAGYQPGVISRGYGGNSEHWPLMVSGDSDVKQVGDEPLLIAQQTQLPVVIGPDRVASATQLLASYPCNVIISDDGLQHYKLARDIEIIVVDGVRRFGNGYMLPAGPLREPVARLQSVDFVVVNVEKYTDSEFAMQLIGEVAVNISTGERKALKAFGQTECHALAGIGHPERFFKMLEHAGINCITHSFPDHYAFDTNDINFRDDKPVLMTEKDAVKCTVIADIRHWFVPVAAVPEPAFGEQLLKRLTQYYDR